MSDTPQVISELPIRLCCGQKHLGPVCPDGKVMCCLCFVRFKVSGLSLTDKSEPVNVCLECAAMEAAVAANQNYQ